MRRNLNFRDTNKVEKAAEDFLKKCPPRSITLLCAIAINDMVEAFHLEDADEDAVAKFIDFHDFIKAQPNNIVQMPVMTVSTPEKAVVPEEKKKVVNGLVTSEAKNAMNDIMASLFNNT